VTPLRFTRLVSRSDESTDKNTSTSGASDPSIAFATHPGHGISRQSVSSGVKKKKKKIPHAYMEEINKEIKKQNFKTMNQNKKKKKKKKRVLTESFLSTPNSVTAMPTDNSGD